MAEPVSQQSVDRDFIRDAGTTISSPGATPTRNLASSKFNTSLGLILRSSYHVQKP